jgi:hypothetical protein
VEEQAVESAERSQVVKTEGTADATIIGPVAGVSVGTIVKGAVGNNR